MTRHVVSWAEDRSYLEGCLRCGFASAMAARIWPTRGTLTGRGRAEHRGLTVGPGRELCRRRFSQPRHGRISLSLKTVVPSFSHFKTPMKQEYGVLHFRPPPRILPVLPPFLGQTVGGRALGPSCALCEDAPEPPSSVP